MKKVLFALSIITTIMACGKSEDKPDFTMVNAIKNTRVYLYTDYEAWKKDDTTKTIFRGPVEADGMIKVPNPPGESQILYMDVVRNDQYNSWGISDSLLFRKYSNANYLFTDELSLEDKNEWTANLVGFAVRPIYKLVDVQANNGSGFTSMWGSQSSCQQQRTLSFSKDYIMTDSPTGCNTDATTTGTFVRFNGLKSGDKITVKPASSTIADCNFTMDKTGPKVRISVTYTVGTVQLRRIFERQ